jgi:protein-disulfide isomerase
MSNGAGSGNLRSFYILFAIVAVIGIGAVGYNFVSGVSGGPAMGPVDLEGVAEDMRLLNELAVPVTKGEEDAPVTIMVFGDYLCNHCATFSLRERPRVEAEYVETGRARLVYYDFVLDPRPEAGRFLAARAARCAGDQGRFWEFHDRLYRSQISWGMESNKMGLFQEFGEQVGLNRNEFRACLNSDRFAEEVSANRQLAQALGLDGTPAVLVGTQGGIPRRVDYLFETIKEAVESFLSGTNQN